MRQLDLPARFAAAIEAVPADWRAGPIGLAVSGGSDSLALLHLAHHWAASSGAPLVVFTVDHRLRPEAADEAEQVAALCARLGLAHQTRVWREPVPRQSAARRARHALLASALTSAGGQLLLTGHTATDQAETFLMRARQGSGWYGLAGIQPVSLSPVWPEGAGIRIARPLQGETREDLRDWLAGQGEGWIDDPSNTNPAFERVRMRAQLSRPGLTARVLACQRGFAYLRAIEDALLANWLGRAVSVLDDGAVQAGLAGLTPERAARGLGLLLQSVAGRDTAPRSDSLQDLAARCLSSDGFRGATLGGVRMRPRGSGFHLSAEPGIDQNPPGPEAIAARITAFRLLFINSAQESAPDGGKESFLQGLTPIFRVNPVSVMRDLP
ncbi:MAG: tRNA lysidine(34) synthetase TilS [Hyphomonas sp.]